MLKYKILNNSNTTELVKIGYTDYKISDDRRIITFTLSNSGDVRNNDTIIMNSVVTVDNIANDILNSANFELITEAITTNDTQLSLNIPTVFPLTAKSCKYYEDEDYCVLEFETPHFFNIDVDKSDRIIYVSNYVNTDSDGVPKEYELYFEYSSINSIYIPRIDNELFFGNFSIKTFSEMFKTFDYSRNDFRFISPQFLTISKRNSIYNIPLMFENNFQTDLFKEELLTINFVEKEKEKAINRIVNMEKQVYYPVYEKDGNREFIDEIVFNLHFREREGDDWTANKNKFWNGTVYALDNTPSAPLCNSSTGNTTFNEPSNQSDLLSYLDFTNNDVMFQKNKLKKSFLRLLFYDSTNQTNQNLLYTSTIFMDSGTLFGKYCRYGEDEPYLAKKDGEIEKVVGIKVDREPSCELLKKYNNNITTCCSKDADLVRDELRLSSQFVIKDKYNNQASSEGFYIYLFSEDDPKLVGKDIYMKIEFNHAGYGRTLPFMYPTNEESNPLSFKEIIEDMKKYKNVDGDIIGYPIKKYYSYTYIKLKCIYDKKLKKHVYYFNKSDSSNIDEEKRKMIINLYEAKVG